MSEIVLPSSFESSVTLAAAPHAVFDFLDDFTRLGSHMMSASWMMAGSRMQYEFDAAGGRAVGGLVRLRGSLLGVPLLIEERVTERGPPFRKEWHTIGRPRMLIMGAYRMGFSILPEPTGCRLTVYIDYVHPQRGAGRILGALLAGWYARWCVRGMLAGAVAHFGSRTAAPGNSTDAAHQAAA